MKSFISIIEKYILFVFLCIVSIGVIFPIAYTIFGSLKENMELMTSTSLLPKKLTFENYTYIWERLKFSRYTFNSIIIAAGTIFGALINSTMSGYVFERRQFPGKKILWSMYLWSMFISLGAATMYPVFKLIVDLKLNNTHLGITLPQIGAQIGNIVLIRGYLSGISKEYDEAAKIDGCNFFGIYYKIILPLITPVLAVIALLTFTASWNSYVMPMILTLGNERLTTLAVAIISMKSSGQMATSWTVMLAGVNMSIIPVIIIYAFANKYFVSGLTLGGLKG